ADAGERTAPLRRQRAGATGDRALRQVRGFPDRGDQTAAGGFAGTAAAGALATDRRAQGRAGRHANHRSDRGARAAADHAAAEVPEAGRTRARAGPVRPQSRRPWRLSCRAREPTLTHFVASYGVWVVGTFIALETVGLPVPAEAALIAAAFFAARTQAIDLWWLIAVAILAAILGNA